MRRGLAEGAAQRGSVDNRGDRRGFSLAVAGALSLTELPDEQQAHAKVQALTENLASDLQTAYESLRSLPDDPVTIEQLTAVDD